MIIWLDDALFNGTKSDIDLLSLLRQAAQRRHTLVISSSPHAMFSDDKPHLTTWLAQNLTEKLLIEVRFLLERLRMISSNLVTRGKSRPIWVTEQSFPSPHACIVDLAQAIRAVTLPLHIMLENQLNDAAFLRTVMPPVWQAKLAAWESSGELRYVQAGGITEMKKLLDFHRRDANALRTFGLPSRIWLLTHFLIYDHDGKSKGSIGEGARALEKVLNKTEISRHRLWRRTQENYLPIATLHKIIAAKGNAPSEKAVIKGAVVQFANLPNAERHYAELPRLGESAYFKNEFAKALNAKNFDPKDFEADGMWPEMTLLAEAIAAAI